MRVIVWVLQILKTVKMLAVRINFTQNTHRNFNPNSNPDVGKGLGLNSELVWE